MTPLEKVARAICRAELYGEPVTDRMVDGAWTTFIPAARAAIEALREPTDAMVKAGTEPGGSMTAAEITWDAMISQALSEEDQ